MKKLFPALAALALIVSMSSCSKEETIGRNDGREPIKFRIATGKVTRSNTQEVNTMNDRVITVLVKNAAGTATNVATEDGTQISTFYLKASGITTNGTTTPTEIAIYATYADATAGTNATNIYQAPESTIYFVAFANLADANMAGIDSKIDFTGSPDVITYDDYVNTPKSDLVWATSGEVTRENKTVNLYFNHIASQLTFSVAQNDGLDIKITGLSISIPGTGDWTSNVSTDGGFIYAAAGAALKTYDMGVAADMEVTTDNANSANTLSQIGVDGTEFASLFVLPCTLGSFNTAGNVAELTVKYEVSTQGADPQVIASNTTGKKVSFASLSGIPLWESAKRYRYTFKPTTPINGYAFTIDMTSWSNGNDEEKIIEPQPGVL